ncbi:MAG: hypothetical protein HY320_11600 [Armatimonadetes bacterium]|nr:hypothetical protein [Armatimonadota bacterium]
MIVNVTARDPAAPGPIKMTLTGDLYHALDLQRMLALELSGDITTRGRVTSNGMTVTVSGQGQIAISETQRWLKIAGKEVPQGD